MTPQRRTLLLSALAAFTAPAIVRAESLMKIKPTEIWVPNRFAKFVLYAGERPELGEFCQNRLGTFICTGFKSADNDLPIPIWDMIPEAPKGNQPAGRGYYFLPDIQFDASRIPLRK